MLYILTSSAFFASANAALRSFTSWRRSLRWPCTSSSVLVISLSCRQQAWQARPGECGKHTQVMHQHMTLQKPFSDCYLRSVQDVRHGVHTNVLIQERLLQDRGAQEIKRLPTSRRKAAAVAQIQLFARAP